MILQIAVGIVIAVLVLTHFRLLLLMTLGVIGGFYWASLIPDSTGGTFVGGIILGALAGLVLEGKLREWA